MKTEQPTHEPKYAYRLPPVHSYDIAGMESWLEELSRQGLHLTSDGFFLGLAVLQKGEGKQYRYRLEAWNPRGLFSSGQEPEDAQVELAEDFGWEYVCRRSYFDIYRTDDPEAPELNTDPSLQSLTLKRVEKELRFTLFWAILYWPLLSFAYRGFFPLLSAIATGSWFMLWLLVLAMGAVLLSLTHIARLARLRRQLLREGGLTHDDRWKARRTGYLVRKGVWNGLIFGFILCFLIRWGTGTLVHEEELPLSQLEQPIPFATLADCFPEGSYTRDADTSGSALSTTHFTRWSSFLAPDALKFVESGKVRQPDGSSFSVVLHVDCYQVRYDWEAEPLLQELMRYDKKNTTKQHWSLLELSGVNADQVLAYQSYFPTVALRKGDYVLKAWFYTISAQGDETLSLETLARTLADSIQVTDE